jgi:cytochrome c peroxidase
MIRKWLAVLVLFSVPVIASVHNAATTTPYTFPKLAGFPPMPQAEDNPVTAEGVDLGRHLFYDPILSIDSTLSCGSCHKQEAAFSDGPSRFSTGSQHNKMFRNTPPLFNLAWYPTLFWDGRAVSIEDQVFHPLRGHNEMNLHWAAAAHRVGQNRFYVERFQVAFGHQPIDSILIAKAIAQFERTLISYRSRYDKLLRGEVAFNKDEADGFVLVNDMTKGDCLHCHTTDGDALGTRPGFSNNGIDSFKDPQSYPDKGHGLVTGKLSDYGKFKIPSLRNVAVTGPYMHDGRFETLEEVIDFYSEGVHYGSNTDPKMGTAHGRHMHLTGDEKRKIIVFLKTLTDSAFLSDPAFSNPFKTHLPD